MSQLGAAHFCACVTTSYKRTGACVQLTAAHPVGAGALALSTRRASRCSMCLRCASVLPNERRDAAARAAQARRAHRVPRALIADIDSAWSVVRNGRTFNALLLALLLAGATASSAATRSLRSLRRPRPWRARVEGHLCERAQMAVSLLVGTDGGRSGVRLLVSVAQIACTRGIVGVVVRPAAASLSSHRPRLSTIRRCRYSPACVRPVSRRVRVCRQP